MCYDVVLQQPKVEFTGSIIYNFIIYIAHNVDSFAQTLLYIGFAAVFAMDPAEISFLYVLHLIRSCGGTKALFGQKDGLQVTINPLTATYLMG